MSSANGARPRQDSTLSIPERVNGRSVSSLLRFQTEEISAAGLLPGEELELETERNRLANAERLTLLIATAASLAGGDDVAETSAADSLRTATRSLEMRPRSISLQSHSERLNEAAVLVDEIALECGIISMGSRPIRSGWKSCRSEWSSIKQLKRKYGGTIEGMLAFAERRPNESWKC